MVSNVGGFWIDLVDHWPLTLWFGIHKRIQRVRHVIILVFSASRAILLQGRDRTLATFVQVLQSGSKLFARLLPISLTFIESVLNLVSKSSSWGFSLTETYQLHGASVFGSKVLLFNKYSCRSRRVAGLHTSILGFSLLVFGKWLGKQLVHLQIDLAHCWNFVF